MVSEEIPPLVLRYWEAKDRWYASGTELPPQVLEFARKFNPPVSARTVSRIRKRWRDLVGRWPPRKGDVRPWLVQNGIVQAELFNVVPEPIHQLRGVRSTGLDDNGVPVIITQFFDTITGRLVDTHIDLHHLLAALVAGLTLIADLSDGHRDHLVELIRWFCRL